MMNMSYLNILRIVFFMSGFAALVYQIAWQRMLFTAFGVDLESITIVIAVFMAGLGIGAYFGGRLADKFPNKIILIFALTEIGIGLFGFLSSDLIAFIKSVFLHSNTLIIALANFILLLFPTFLMGSTLPLLTQYLNNYIDNNIGNNIGWLYFVNTLGAATACLVTGFYLFNHFQLDEVVYIAAGINVFVAIAIFSIYGTEKHNKNIKLINKGEEQPIEVADFSLVRKAILLSFLGGFLSLGLEVIWIRLFSLYSSSIPQAFAFILALFLLGIAFGSLIGKDVCKRKQANLNYIGRIFLVSTLFDSIAILSIIYYPNFIVFTFSVLLVALLRGIIFPIVHHLGSGNRKTGAAISNVYFANVLGCTLAPIFFGFFLLDILNTQQVYLVIIAISLLIAFFCLKLIWLKIISLFSLLAISSMVFLPERIINSLVQKPNLVLEKLIENKHGFIQVYKDKYDDHLVFGSNVYDGMLNIDITHNSNGIHRAYLLPVIAPQSKNILVVGLSTGSWVRVLSSMPNVESITVIELNPGYPSLADSYSAMRKVLEDKRIKIITDDGRRWLVKNQQDKFDFILMNTTFHWRSYATNLLSQEFLELTKSHLTENGFIYFNTTESTDAFFTASKVYPYTYQYGNMALASLKPVLELDEYNVYTNLSQLKWRDTKFDSEEYLKLATNILLGQPLIAYTEKSQFALPRQPEMITDKNMITEYKYGILSK
ncbi:Spermidine synthase [Pasteurella multocida]|nr:Spermidine synthase [Pasteurella multocida]